MSLSLPAPSPLFIQNSFIGSVPRKCRLKGVYKLLRFFLRSITVDFGVRHPHLPKICVLYHYPCLAKVSFSQCSAHKCTSNNLDAFEENTLRFSFYSKCLIFFHQIFFMSTKKTKVLSQFLVIHNDTMNYKSFMCVLVLVVTLVSAPGLHSQAVFISHS